MALPQEIAGAAPTAESDPSALGSWMSTLPSFGEPQDTPKDGSPAPPRTEGKREEDKPQPPPAPPATPAPAKVPDDTQKATDKTAEKPAAAKEDEEGEEKWPRSKDDWAKFKAKRKQKEDSLTAEINAREGKLTESEKRIQTLESELATLKEKGSTADPNVSSEIERLKKENEELSTRLAVTDVVQHPKFQAHFKGRVDEQMDEIRTIFEKEKADEVIKALELPEGDFKKLRIEELINDMTPFENSQFGGVVKELRKIERDRQAAIADSKEKKEKLDTQTKTEAEKRVAESKRIFSEVIKEAQDPKNGMVIFQQKDGDTEWNKGVKERLAVAERYLFGAPDMDPKHLMKGALHAAAFPALMQSYLAEKKSLEGEITKLQAQVKELSAAQPRIGAGAGPSDGESSSGGKRIERGMSPSEASAEFFKRLHSQSE